MKKKVKKRNANKALFIAIAIIAAGSAFFVIRSMSSDVLPHMAQQKIRNNATQLVRIVFVGDIMLDRGVRTTVTKNLGGDYTALFKNTGYLKDADIAFANLEGPVATGGYKAGSRFSFRMDPAGLVAMRDAGFDVVSFANNHVGDYARAAFTETFEHLRENNILFAGAGMNRTEATTPAIIDVRDMKIGFLAATDVGPDWLQATDTAPGILIASDPDLPLIIATAKAQVDVLVMSFHWGNEYSPANQHQETLAHMAIDAGADIIIGHHPHVMEKVVIYKDKPIFYSLGNFIFDQYFSPHTLRGMVAEVSINPETKMITATERVSPQDKQFVPQALIPFDPSMLVTKTFTP
jgi:poly-gamma-glutamate capsule biosynthesis protein CapA/YwtB (metallophosphatase superfamily)